MEDKELKVEEHAITYANTQPKGEWNASKKGYMAGALDFIAPESPLMMLVGFALQQTANGNAFFFSYHGHINGGSFSIWGYRGEWHQYKDPIEKFTLDVKDINLSKANRIMAEFVSKLNDK